MSILEEAVKNLAGALDALETRLDERLGELSQNTETVEAAHRQARVARGHANEASAGLAQAIGDLKALLGESGR